MPADRKPPKPSARASDGGPDEDAVMARMREISTSVVTARPPRRPARTQSRPAHEQDRERPAPVRTSDPTGPRRDLRTVRRLLAHAERPAAEDVELRALVESLPVPALIARRSDGRLTVLNELLEPMFGHRTKELLYRPDRVLYADTSDHRALIETLAKEGKVHAHELRVRRADGSLRWVAVSARSLAHLGHDVYLYVFFDISQRIEMEERLHHTGQQLEMVSLGKSVSLTHVAHELRAPLHAIIGYAELMAERAEELGDDELIGDVHRILQVCQLQGDILDNALDLSKIETGRMAIKSEPYHVDEVVAEAVHAARPLCQRNANRLTVHGAESLGQSRGDPRRVYQILVNLLGNAAKFTAEGEITFEAARTYLPADEREWLVFTVRDNGVGMNEVQLARLFQPFTPGQEPTYDGTGFGLKISRELALRMGGEITAVSLPRQGAVFTVYLPVDDSDTG